MKLLLFSRGKLDESQRVIEDKESQILKLKSEKESIQSELESQQQNIKNKIEA